MASNATVARDLKGRFPRVWCPTCNKTQAMIFDVMEANDKNEHDAADIVCGQCKSIIATLHGPSVRRTGVPRKRAARAQEMAAQLIG
jgi:ribosomal protein S27E